MKKRAAEGYLAIFDSIHFTLFLISVPVSHIVLVSLYFSFYLIIRNGVHPLNILAKHSDVYLLFALISIS